MAVASCVMLYHYSVTLKATMQPAILRNRVQKVSRCTPRIQFFSHCFWRVRKAKESGVVYDRCWM